MSVRNVAGTIANIFAADQAAVEGIQHAVEKHADRLMAVWGPLVPVKTGFLQSAREVRLLPSKLGYEAGWWRERFTARGLRFYAPAVEFGTSRQRAQPSLGPATREVEPEFRGDLRTKIRAALARRRFA